MHASITTERIIEILENHGSFGLSDPGICTACGEDHDGCEPDARRYPCECCGELAVYGAQELLLMTVA